MRRKIMIGRNESKILRAILKENLEEKPNPALISNPIISNPTILRSKAYEFIASTKGLIIGAEFIKRTTGEKRNINCIYGVKNPKKPLTGKGLKFNPKSKGLILVYDLKKEEYRFINLDGLISVTIRKIKYLMV